MSSKMKEIKDVLVNDPNSELIDYLMEETRKKARREYTLCILTISRDIAFHPNIRQQFLFSH